MQLPEIFHRRRRAEWWELTKQECEVLAALCHGQAMFHVAHPNGNLARERQYRRLAQKLHGRPRGRG